MPPLRQHIACDGPQPDFAADSHLKAADLVLVASILRDGRIENCRRLALPVVQCAAGGAAKAS